MYLLFDNELASNYQAISLISVFNSIKPKRIGTSNLYGSKKEMKNNSEFIKIVDWQGFTTQVVKQFSE